MTKRLLTLLLLVQVLLCCGKVHAANFTVDRNDDINGGACTATANDCTLRDAITLANGAAGSDTIDFIESIGTITLTAELPALSSNLTIDGPDVYGVAISGTRPFGVPEVANLVVGAGQTVSIDDVMITGGYTGIKNSGNLSLNRCTVSGAHTTQGFGGAISNEGTLTVADSSIYSNTAVRGAAIYSSGGLVTVMNSTLANNTSSAGGAVYSSSSLVISGSTIFGNSAGYGGAILVELNGSATLVNNTITGNSANDYGGGIASYGALTMDNCTVTANRANANGVNDIHDTGGGLWSSGTATLRNNIVAGNYAGTGTPPDDISGSIATARYNLIGDAATSGGITDGTEGNIVGVNGSGTRATATILNATLAYNGGNTRTHALISGSPAIDAAGSAGAPATDQRAVPRPQGSSVDIGAFELSPVPAGPAYVVDTTQDGDDSDYSPGDLSLREALLFANSDGVDSSITFDATVFAAPRKTITLNGSHLNIESNDKLTVTAPAAGVIISGDGQSRVWNTATGSEAILTGLTITEGSAYFNFGGGINNNGSLTLTNCVVTENQATTPAGTFNTGGGAYNFGTLIVNNCVFSNNAANMGGGGVRNLGTLTVNNSTFSGNRVTENLGNGGALYNTGIMIVSNSTISDNTAASHGGGVYSVTAAVDGNMGTTPATYTLLRNCTISGNSASSVGGGIRNTTGLTLLDSCTVVGNKAPLNSGGGISSDDSTETVTRLTNSIVVDNRQLNNTPGTDIDHGGINSFESQGYNLIGDGNATGNFGTGANSSTDQTIGDASSGLGPLADNGGPTRTHALLAGSPALDRGNTTLPTDQRGITRPQNGAADIGAFELTAAVSISGTIRTSTSMPLAGVSVQFSSNGTPVGPPVTTDSNGFYQKTGLGFGTYTITPTRSGYGFSPATRTVNVTSAFTNLTNQNFTASNATLNGRVAFSNGVGIGNVQVRLNNGRSVFTNGAGYYTFTGMLNGSYTVTPVLSGYSFDPALRSVTINNNNAVNVNFTGGYSISGRIANVTGTGLAGLRVYRSGSPYPAVTNSAGYYTFYGVVNGTYTLTPDTTQGYGYTPQTRSVPVNGANVINQNFVGTSGYSISGRIATSNGTGIAGVTVVRSGSATPVTTNGAGYYTFHGVVNGNYALTPSKSGYTFTPPNKSVSVNGANVANQNFIGSGG